MAKKTPGNPQKDADFEAFINQMEDLTPYREVDNINPKLIKRAITAAFAFAGRVVFMAITRVQQDNGEGHINELKRQLQDQQQQIDELRNEIGWHAPEEPRPVA